SRRDHAQLPPSPRQLGVRRPRARRASQHDPEPHADRAGGARDRPRRPRPERGALDRAAGTDRAAPDGRSMTARPLDGILVADLTRVLAGPTATMMLADLGARVVKVERPGLGDDTRRFGPPWAGSSSAYYESANRTKESI